MNSNNMLVNGYQSIVYAAEHNCDIINCSWGGAFYQKMAQDVVNYVTINFDMQVLRTVYAKLKYSIKIIDIEGFYI
jgi:hypothetical protein